MFGQDVGNLFSAKNILYARIFANLFYYLFILLFVFYILDVLFQELVFARRLLNSVVSARRM